MNYKSSSDDHLLSSDRASPVALTSVLPKAMSPAQDFVAGSSSSSGVSTPAARASPARLTPPAVTITAAPESSKEDAKTMSQIVSFLMDGIF